MTIETPTGFVVFHNAPIRSSATVRRLAVSRCGDPADAHGHGIGLQLELEGPPGGFATLILSRSEASDLARSLLMASGRDAMP